MALVCKICNKDEVDNTQFGVIMHGKEVTAAHYFCLLFSAKLGSTEKKGALIGNFLESHVKKEIKRAKKLECFYCKQLGANIDCCYENCGKSFHVPCAVREHCLFEFIDKYPSFCHKHSVLQIAKTERFPNEKHSANEICCICKDEMNKYHPIESFQLTQNDWCHKLCMMQYAQASAVHFKCPLNHLDVDTFKNVAVRRGIFIPDSDAAWEMNPNYFVGLTERPKMCAAATNKDCQHPDGPVFVELSDIVKCNCCGDSLHDMCIIKVRLYEEESFYCDTCFGESYEKSIRNKMTTVLPDIRSMLKRPTDATGGYEDFIQPGKKRRLNREGMIEL